MLMRRREFGQMAAVMTALAAAGLAGCSGGSGGAGDGGEVTLEFTQWWEPELPDGALRALMDQFEQANPGIKVELLSGPYASTKEQLVAGAAARTMPDVVGLDGAWVSDFAQQGAIADLTALMAEQGYDDAELASQIQIDGATYMIPVVNFVYPMFANMDLLKQAGVSEIPSTREEFVAAAKAVAATGGDISGWALPLSLEAPNGIQNDVMSWVWASGGSMLTEDGRPNLQGNADVKSACEFIKGLWDAGVVSPGAFTMKEQDKVEDFTNARVGMMIDSLAHVNTIREGNPDLEFGISALPAVSGYTGDRGMPYASWGIGVSGTTEHPEQAWKLVEFLMSADINAVLADDAKAFPGNSTATPDYVEKDELFKQAFDIWSSGTPANEFTGLPVSETLMRKFDEQFQTYLSGDIDVDTMLANAQKAWDAEF
ncbi:multiple sugar transport system substrate-binding protein [Actinomyces ruminicola]|uniref:Multiple sugar transport system substrate-binding protein n=2 Tax=Actinomyces ruminicola TaxID=332524 RepID=A0A1G9S0A0_9ACTO|nr:multiple sugar transport system substrate-binding protein [Actinomyces ruminicola]